MSLDESRIRLGMGYREVEVTVVFGFWMHGASMKYRQLSTGQSCIMSQNTWIFIIMSAVILKYHKYITHLEEYQSCKIHSVMGLILVSGHNCQDFTKSSLLVTACLVEHGTWQSLSCSRNSIFFFIEVEGSFLFSEEPNTAISCESFLQLHTLLLWTLLFLNLFLTIFKINSV